MAPSPLCIVHCYRAFLRYNQRTLTALTALTNAFPLWVLVASLLALVRPALFTWFSGSMIPAGLAIIMLSMGMTLGFADFRRVARRQRHVMTGVVLQYTVMPLLGWLVAAAYDLPTPFAVGLILVACCPGGTASNLVAYLARADVALSVTMTAMTTVMAVVMTPSLTAMLAGSRVDVPAGGLLLSTVQVVILPIVAGALLQKYFPRATQAVLPAAPLVAVLTITLIVGSIIGAGREQLVAAGVRLVAAVFSLHAGGFLAGYVLSRVWLRHELAARTISIEVGMQNSGLGVVLAQQNFANPLVALPCAISSVFHSLIASSVAAVWRLSAARYGSAVAAPAARATVAPSVSVTRE